MQKFIFLVSILILSLACNKKDNTSSNNCKNVTCLNGGTCVNGTCSCSSGYEGTDCSGVIRKKFIGTYKGYSKNSHTNDSLMITVTITENTDIDKVAIAGLKDFYQSQNLPTQICKMTSSTHCGIETSGYVILCDSYESDTKIHLSYIVKSGDQTYTFEGKKQ